MGAGRLLLLIYLENQRNDADDQDTELKQVGISDHDITPLRCSGGGSKKCGLLPKEGPPPTAYWQRQRISMRQGHCSIICRIWKELIGSLSHGCAVPAPPEGEPRLYLSLRGGAKPRRGNPYPTQKTNPPTGGLTNFQIMLY